MQLDNALERHFSRLEREVRLGFRQGLGWCLSASLCIFTSLIYPAAGDKASSPLNKAEIAEPFLGQSAVA